MLDKDGAAIDGVYCIGDANGKLMLAHAASAQGISAIENMKGRPHVLNHRSVPAACFTHPEVSFVGVTEEQAREEAAAGGYEVRRRSRCCPVHTAAATIWPALCFVTMSRSCATRTGEATRQAPSLHPACVLHAVHPFCPNRGAAMAEAESERCTTRAQVAVAKTSFKANSKALAEREGDGMAKMIFRADTGAILGVHIIGLHAADLIHEASNAIATGQTVGDIKFNVHAHPTLSEVLDELFKEAAGALPVASEMATPAEPVVQYA